MAEMQKIAFPPFFMLFAAAFYEFYEQRLRFVRATFEFRVELYAHKERIFLFGKFNRLYKQFVRRSAAYYKPRLFHLLSVFIAEFVAVAVAFFD